MQIKVSTFNIENLFTRFDFSTFYPGGNSERSRRYLPPIVNFLADFDGADIESFGDFRSLIRSATVSQDDDKRQHTALAMAETEADIICLQEVDSFGALTRFNDFYVKKLGKQLFSQLVLHEGNDIRGIDVAAIAENRVPMLSRSHAGFTVGDLGDGAERELLHNRYPETKKVIGPRKRGRLFKRDCLEIEVNRRFRSSKRSVSIFVCHFKSMGGGRKETVGVRQAEALAVKQIIENKFDEPEKAHWLIVGDLNDYRQQVKVRSALDAAGNNFEEVVELGAGEPSGIDPLIDDGFSVNLVDRREPKDRWTHYYSAEKSKSQLDYILASPALADANPDVVPTIVRTGLPYRVPNTDGYQRYPRLGWDRPKASDHCPVTVELTIPDADT